MRRTLSLLELRRGRLETILARHAEQHQGGSAALMAL